MSGIGSESACRAVEAVENRKKVGRRGNDWRNAFVVVVVVVAVERIVSETGKEIFGYDLREEARI